jgi:hypothetical protein
MQCFVGYYILINMVTGIHRDIKDLLRGWVAMVVFGEYEKGELGLPDVCIAIPYQDCDIVFIRSWTLRHFIRKFEGTRYVIVFNTPQDVFRHKWEV